MSPEGRIKFKLLGKFSVRKSDDELRVPSSKGRMLCALLAIGPSELCTRKRLSSLLWEDRPSEQALVSLRQELARLRSALHSRSVTDWSDGNFLKLPPHIDVDVIQFLKAISNGDAAQVAELYSGSFMEGEEDRGPLLSEWIAKSRREFALRALAACEASLARRAGLSAHQREKIAELIVRLNPGAEGASISLIEAYSAQGKTAQAIERYRSLAEGLIAKGRKVPPLAEADMARLLEGSREDQVNVPNDASKELNWLDEINRQHYEAAAPGPRFLVPPRDQPSVAVLPFRDVTPLPSPLPGYEDGLTEETTTALARIRDLFVIARQSAQVYRREFKDVRQIAVELGVAYLVEGSIEIASETVE